MKVWSDAAHKMAAAGPGDGVSEGDLWGKTVMAGNGTDFGVSTLTGLMLA